MAGSGSTPHASACATWARPISPPARHGQELLDMFCALHGATDRPRRRSQAHSAVVIQLLPAFDDVPPTKSPRASPMTGPRALTRPLRQHPRGVALDARLLRDQRTARAQLALRQQVPAAATGATLEQM